MSKLDRSHYGVSLVRYECSESERRMQELHYYRICCTRHRRSSDDDTEMRRIGSTEE